MDKASAQLFEIEATDVHPRKIFKIIKGAVPAPIEDEDAIPAEQIQGSEWDPQSFAELDELVAVKVALARHHREVAEARLADAKAFEQQLQGLLRKYFHLVPQPAPDKKWKATVGAVSGGSYRYQPERAPQYEFAERDVAREAGLTTIYETIKVDLEAVRQYESKHGSTDIPGIKRTEPCVVSFSPLKGDKC